MNKQTDFLYSSESEQHHIRAKRILKENPEIRLLIGKNVGTIYIILGLVIFMVVMAYFMRSQPWWVIFLAAYLLGAFADHALFVMVHECTHNLIFKNKAANRLAGMLSNLPQIFPSSISFERHHLKHHTYLGVHDLDADLPSRWEARLISNSFLGKALWLLLFPLFQIFRLSRLQEVKPFDGWMAANYAVQILFTAAVWYFWGWHAIVFLFFSFLFSIGLHPLGARWISEHYLTTNVNEKEHETHSYYGGFNTVAFNIGYHNEHHDFPSIPWNRLPEVKSAAAKHYDGLNYHSSWTKLFFQFLFDKEISLYNRLIRQKRNKTAAAANRKEPEPVTH
jgi:sphingolipid delta-4 desaturase